MARLPELAPRAWLHVMKTDSADDFQNGCEDQNADPSQRARRRGGVRGVHGPCILNL
ncbi:MAG TPA: hypothetical protein VKM54_19850 [Myxococcota bacterium]|nr:hypothetical protein [Myxococcota bacterium]